MVDIILFCICILFGSLIYLLGYYTGKQRIIIRTYEFLRKINRGQQIPQYDEFINNK